MRVSVFLFLALNLFGAALAQNAYYLPQVGNGELAGGALKTTFILFNTGADPVSVHLSLTKSDGNPMPVTLQGIGTKSEFDVVLGPGETWMRQTNGTGNLVVGAATLTSDREIGASAIFSILDDKGRFLTEAGVGGAIPLTRFVLPVNTSSAFQTGLAIYNPGTSGANLTLRLFDESGTERGVKQSSLNAGRHSAQFIAELFPTATNFSGTLQVASDTPLTALAIRQNSTPLSFTTLPVVSLASDQKQFDLPQIADGQMSGGAIKTTFVLFNLSNQQASVQLSLTKDDGTSFPVNIPGQGTQSAFSLELEPNASRFLETSGEGLLTAGACRVTSDLPIGVSAIFTVYDDTGNFMTEAGVGDAGGREAFQMPVDYSLSSNTGVAFYNNDLVPAQIRVTLVSQDRSFVREGEPFVLEGKNHRAKFITELFPGITPISGSMIVTASRPVSALTIRQNAAPLVFTTLPVSARTEGFPTSAVLIDQAVSEGDLNNEQALIYKTFAAFGDVRLPATYKGNDLVIDEDFIDEIANNLSAYTPETQAILKPFLVPPFYEGSWFDLQNSASGYGAFRSGKPPCTMDEWCPTGLAWTSIDTTKSKFRIWYISTSTRDAANARNLVTEIDNVIWPALYGLMEKEPISDAGKKNNGGDGRLDIALVPLKGMLGANINGWGGRYAEPVFIMIENNQSWDDLVAAVTHELMHSIQWAYDVKAFSLRGGYKWLMEATATWAEDFVYNTTPGGLHPEHGFLPDFLNVPEKSLDADPTARHPYGAYLFPFYLARGYSDRWIRFIWEATEQKSESLEAVQAGMDRGGATDFEHRWPEFVRRNWNTNPVTNYQSWDSIISTPKLVKDEEVKLSGQKDKKIPLDLTLPHLSANYFRYKFRDADIRTVAFYNGISYQYEEKPLEEMVVPMMDDLSESQRKGANVQALVKIEGQPWREAEDWTNLPAVAFCRDLPDERLEELVLIFSNTEHDEDGENFELLEAKKDKPTLWASNMGCAAWNGTSEITRVDDGVTEKLNATLKLKRAPTHSGTYGTTVPLVRQTEKGAVIGHFYELDSGQVNWEISGNEGSCSVSGKATLPISLANLVTFNYISTGTFHRAFTFAGFTQNILEWMVNKTYTCPPDEGGTYTSTEPVLLFLGMDPVTDPASATVKTSGDEIDATDSESGGKLKLKAVRK